MNMTFIVLLEFLLFSRIVCIYLFFFWLEHLFFLSLLLL